MLDDIVGIIYLISVVLCLSVDIQWVYLAGVVAVLQISSYFTGFCPVYFLLDKFTHESGHKRAGSKPI
jgi:Kef-type K+ transport system membrane component KefB